MKFTMMMPRFNPNDDEFQVMQWHIADHTWVEKGQELVDVESAKATICLESEAAGYLVRACNEGAVVQVGAPLAFFYSDLSELTEPNPAAPPTDDLHHAYEVGPTFANQALTPTNGVKAEATADDTLRFSKSALAYLEEHKLDPTLFNDMGLVSLPMLKKRVEELAQTPPPPQPASASVTPAALIAGASGVEQPHQPMKVRTKAVTRAKKLEIERLSEGQAGGINSSLTVQFNSAPIRQKLAAPTVFNGLLSGQILPLILYELAQLLKEYPDFTAYYDQGCIYYYDRVDIGVAIDLDQGLKAPVIRQADSLSPVQLFEALLAYVTDYQEKRLTSDNLSGGAITVTDLSNDQILYFQPLLNAQQAVILGIGGERALEGYPMTLTLVFDHRVLSGRQVGLFLNALKQRLLDFAPVEDGVMPVEQPLTPAKTAAETAASARSTLPNAEAPLRRWQRRTAVTRSKQLPTGPYLLFVESSSLSQQMVATLTALGQACIQVERGTDFVQLDRTHYRLNPTDAQSYRQLVTAVAAERLHIAQIIYLWSYAPIDTGGTPVATCRETAQRIQENLPPLLAALADAERRNLTQHPRALYLISNRLQPSPMAEADNGQGDAAPSLWQWMAEQYPWLRGFHIDLQNDTVLADRNALLRALLTVSKANEVVYHAGERWQPVSAAQSALPTLQPEKLIGWATRTPESTAAPTTPHTALESRLVALWQELLKGKHIGIHDNFFELGGNSLVLVRLLNRLHTEIDPTLTLMDLFRYPTIARLCQKLAPIVAAAPMAQPTLALLAQPAVTTIKATAESDEIAIIGMAGRFPGAASLAEFWQNLSEGKEAIQIFSDEALRAAGVAPDLLHDPNYVKAGAILPDIEQFDAAFFGFTPREAELLDPQTRLFLEAAWEALEHAGCNPQRYPGKIGLYAGTGLNTYLQNNLYHGFDPTTSVHAYQAFIANDKDYLTTRVAYKLNLRGPSVTVQTACSTSLVAIHLAKQSLLTGECDLALAGSVSVRVPHTSGYLYQEGLIFSPDGHCRAFDAQARGTVFGHGLGIVVLKRLRAALADGDVIYAVVKGSAINNDGAAKVGYTAPSIDGQIQVITEALTNAKVTADTITYVETHGTGTQLGDPIEVTALTEAFRAWRQDGTAPAAQRCALGAVKTNIGHLDIAAGIAGVIKTTLSLTHRQLPPTLHFTTPNPAIAWADTPFYVNTELLPWETGGLPRRAGVSSFGVGGTNAHLILEEAPVQTAVGNPVEPTSFLLTLSARDEGALLALVERYIDFLAETGLEAVEPALADICFTSHVGRVHFEQRLSVVVSSKRELHETLIKVRAGETPPNTIHGQGQAQSDARIAFIFTGQGSQYVNMGRELYETQPFFRQTMERCDEILRPLLGESLLSILYPEAPMTTEGQPSKLNITSYAQPALFALEYALTQLWRSWGIEPTVLIGHSLGEYVAACVAGVFSLEDGLKLIAARGRLMEAFCEKGKMFWVMSNEAYVQSVLAPYPHELAIAGANSPENVVISGKADAVDQVVAEFAAQGIKARQLMTVAHAFHSPLMEPMLAEFAQVANTIRYARPTMTMISNLTGEVAGDEITRPDYWVRHVRATVRFADGITAVCRQGCDTFIEIGAKPTLLAVARQNVAGDYGLWHPSLHAQSSNWQQLLESLGQLYVQGVTIDWAGLDHGYARRKVALPTYPFQRQRYWMDSVTLTTPMGQSRAGRTNKLLHSRLSLPRSDEVRFEVLLNLRNHAYVDHHRYYGTPVVPASAFITIILSAVKETFGVDSCVLQSIFFAHAMNLGETSTALAQLILKPQGEARYAFEVVSLTEEDEREAEWRLHATGEVLVPPQNDPPLQHGFDLAAIQARCPVLLSQDQLYAGLSAPTDPFYVGDQLHWGKLCWLGDNEALCKLEMPELLDTIEDFQLHPGIIEGPAGPLMCLARRIAGEKINLIAFAIDSYRFHAPPTPSAELWFYVKMKEQSEFKELATLRSETYLLDATGRLLAEMIGFELRPISPDLLAATTQAAPQKRANTRAPAPKAELPQQALYHQLLALPVEQRQAQMEQYVRTVISHVLGLRQADALDRTQSFFEMGLDSLMSVELRSQLQRSVNVSLPATIAFSYPTITEMAAHLLQKLFPPATASELAGNAPQATSGITPITDVLAGTTHGTTNLHAISDSEAEALLLAQLAELESEA